MMDKIIEFDQFVMNGIIFWMMFDILLGMIYFGIKRMIDMYEVK